MVLHLQNNICQFSVVPPRIDGPTEEDVVETISNPVSFACDATGIPPPSLAWLKNGRPIGGATFKFLSQKWKNALRPFRHVT